jgi:hypothetical protein
MHNGEAFLETGTQVGSFEYKIIMQPHPDKTLNEQLNKSVTGRKEFRNILLIILEIVLNRMGKDLL